MQLNRAFNLDLSQRLNHSTGPARQHQIQNVNVKQDVDVENNNTDINTNNQDSCCLFFCINFHPFDWEKRMLAN